MIIKRSFLPKVAILVLAFTGLSPKYPGFASDSDKIEELAMEHFKDAISFGIEIKSLDGKIVYKKDENKNFYYASGTKLLTTLVALDTLGPQYRFRTEFLTDGVIDNYILEGNLIVKGYGDPYLVTEALSIAAREISHLGIKTIKGNIYVDNSNFLAVPSRYNDGTFRAYNAPIAATSVNFNSVSIHLHSLPWHRCPLVFIEPDIGLVSYRYKNCTGSIKLITTNGLSYIIEGRPSHSKAVFYRYYPLPKDYVASLVKYLLEKNGVFVAGQNVGTTKELKLLYTHKSRPLWELIALMDKYSNNFMADMIYMVVGAERFKWPAEPGKSKRVYGSFIKKLGFEDSGWYLENGSGLGKDRFSPSLMVAILEYGIQHFGIFPEFLSALSIAGRDGTLKDRFKGSLLGKIRAKTGTLKDVVSLSGFFNIDGNTYTFSIVVNGFKKGNNDDMIKEVDGFLDDITKFLKK